MVYRIFLSCPMFGKYPYFISLVPVLSNINSLNSLQSYFFKIISIIIFPYMCWSTNWFLSFAFSHQTYLCISLLLRNPHTLPYNPGFDQLRTWRVQTLKLHIVHICVALCYFLHLRSKYSPRYPQFMFFPKCESEVIDGYYTCVWWRITSKYVFY